MGLRPMASALWGNLWRIAAGSSSLARPIRKQDLPMPAYDILIADDHPLFRLSLIHI